METVPLYERIEFMRVVFASTRLRPMAGDGRRPALVDKFAGAKMLRDAECAWAVAEAKRCFCLLFFNAKVDVRGPIKYDDKTVSPCDRIISPGVTKDCVVESSSDSFYVFSRHRELEPSDIPIVRSVGWLAASWPFEVRQAERCQEVYVPATWLESDEMGAMVHRLKTFELLRIGIANGGSTALEDREVIMLIVLAITVALLVVFHIWMNTSRC